MNGHRPRSEAEEVTWLISLGQKYLWKGSKVKAQLEANGIQLIPRSFYSPVPTVEEVRSSWELRDGATPYLESNLYDNKFMVDFLNLSLRPFAADFNPPLNPTDNPAEFSWSNDQFSYSDALAYHCMIRHLRPSHIVEVGGGYSSLVAAQALRNTGRGELVLIDPSPREWLGRISPMPTIIRQPVQDISVSYFKQLDKNDILFIDSSHSVKAGSDCVYIYLKILPSLNRGVVVHAHDIFLPQMMPEKWLNELHIYWTEQYLLQAYLLDNPKVKILFGSNYHAHLNPTALNAFMAGKFPAGGSSFWFQIRSDELWGLGENGASRE